LSLLTEEKFVEFLKSGKFCEIFGHTMESTGKAYSSMPLSITLDDKTIKLSQENITHHNQQCRFCHRRVLWTKESGTWETQYEGGLEKWNG